MPKALVRIGLLVVGFIIGGLTMLIIYEPLKPFFSETGRFKIVKPLVFGVYHSIGWLLIFDPIADTFDGIYATRNRSTFRSLRVSTGGRISELLSLRKSMMPTRTARPVTDLLFDRCYRQGG